MADLECNQASRPPGFLGELLAVERSLWSFATVEGVTPHNNAAERALLHGEIRRKTSHGTDSEAGSRFVERMPAKRLELEAMGLVFEVETVVDNDSMTTAFCNDPAGNRIQIVKRKKPLGAG